MAELTVPTSTSTASCCAPETQSSCCAPSDKDACCGTAAAGGRCGCAAGQPAEAPAADIRETVRAKYASAARAAAEAGSSSCCGPITLTDADEAQVFGAALYDDAATEGANATAVRASLGCGVPTAVANLHEGETVLDLGSGAGADVLISARRVGPTGRAIGLDMTDEMLELARANAAEAGVTNAEFVKGFIEELPLPDASVDVVISNCVINLAGDKPKVVAEAARVLKPGGRFAVSDVIAAPDMDERTRADVALYTGCIAGALTEQEFRDALIRAGLTDIEVHETHRVHEHATSAIVRARKPASRRARDNMKTTAAVGLRPAGHADAEAIAAIYSQGIAERQATFDTEPVGAADVQAWLGDDSQPVLVAEAEGRVVGWARVIKSQERCAFAGVGEYTIYVDAAARGRGIGRRLLDALVGAAEGAGYWKIQGRLLTTNAASRALARRRGFREVGVYERHGRLDGEWRDLLIVEHLLGDAAR